MSDTDDVEYEEYEESWTGRIAIAAVIALALIAGAFFAGRALAGEAARRRSADGRSAAGPRPATCRCGEIGGRDALTPGARRRTARGRRRIPRRRASASGDRPAAAERRPRALRRRPDRPGHRGQRRLAHARPARWARRPSSSTAQTTINKSASRRGRRHQGRRLGARRRRRSGRRDERARSSRRTGLARVLGRQRVRRRLARSPHDRDLEVLGAAVAAGDPVVDAVARVALGRAVERPCRRTSRRCRSSSAPARRAGA